MYDATEKYDPKGRMPKYSISHVKRGDLVLAEVQVTRYRDQDDGTPEADRWKWQQWVAQLALMRLSVLHVTERKTNVNGARNHDDEFEF